jgi:hypothetical protein
VVSWYDTNGTFVSPAVHYQNAFYFGAGGSIWYIDRETALISAWVSTDATMFEGLNCSGTGYVSAIAAPRWANRYTRPDGVVQYVTRPDGLQFAPSNTPIRSGFWSGACNNFGAGSFLGGDGLPVSGLQILPGLPTVTFAGPLHLTAQ